MPSRQSPQGLGSGGECSESQSTGGVWPHCGGTEQGWPSGEAGVAEHSGGWRARRQTCRDPRMPSAHPSPIPAGQQGCGGGGEGSQGRRQQSPRPERRYSRLGGLLRSFPGVWALPLRRESGERKLPETTMKLLYLPFSEPVSQDDSEERDLGLQGFVVVTCLS